MGSELCLKYKPEVIATAFVYGAAHDLFGALEHPSETTKMWELWDGLKTSTVNEKLLHDIMVELYTYVLHGPFSCLPTYVSSSALCWMFFFFCYCGGCVAS